MPDSVSAPLTSIVHILVGQTGEYSDRCDWWVRAYLDEAVANAECAKLNALVEEAGLSENNLLPQWASREKALTERIKPHDAQAQVDYTGLWYSVGSVELAK